MSKRRMMNRNGRKLIAKTYKGLLNLPRIPQATNANLERLHVIVANMCEYEEWERNNYGA